MTFYARDPEAVARARRALSCRIAAGVLALPPLIAWLILSALTLFHIERLVDTGDSLLDAWIETAHPGARSRGPEGMPLKVATDSIPDGSWSRIERDFGSDPRFWLLRSNQQWNEIWASYFELAASSEETWLNTAYFEKGIKDPVLLFHLMHAKTGDPPVPMEYSSSDPGTLHVLSDPHTAGPDPTESKLARDLLAGAGDQAQVLYYFAGIEYSRGKIDAAYRYLEQGNAAPRNDPLSGTPNDEIWRSLEKPKPLGGDKFLAATLAMQLEANPHPLPSMSFIDVLADEAAGSGDLRRLAVLHQARCRIGLALVAARRDPAYYLGKMGANAKDYRNSQAGRLLTSPQKQALDLLSARIKQFPTQLATVPVLGGWASAASSIPRKKLLLEFATRGESAITAYLEDSVRYVMVDEPASRAKMSAALRDLARFDYVTCSWRK